VISPLARPQVKSDLQSLLLEMANDPDAQDALASIGVQSFVIIEDSAYDSVRELINIIPIPNSP
jgi:ABC-type phosphate/phosphonate transport system substrate-binding protein